MITDGGHDRAVDSGATGPDPVGDPTGEGEPEPFVYDATVAPSATDQMVRLLHEGTLEVLGLMPWASNGTFLVNVSCGDDHAPAIYKPASAERTLWDFPHGIYKREVATWELSEILGFGLVPPTVGRSEGPMGAGSLQAFIPARFEEHYFTLRDTTDGTLALALRKLCVLDLVANATDRKGGHCLVDRDNRLWAIDNGLTFHEEFKLRTVIWDFSGEEIPESTLAPLRRLVSDGVPARLTRWLSGAEVDATVARAAKVLESRHFPHDHSGHRYPWPLV